MIDRPDFLLELPPLHRVREGNTGVEGVWRFQSQEEGPRVAVTALIHGNELCGAWAALALVELLQSGKLLRRGQLTVAFCNLEAFDRFDPLDPDASRFVEEDLNRQWSEDRLADPSSQERRRACEILPWIEDADMLLDLHSMHETGSPLLLAGPLKRHISFALDMGMAGHVVVDVGHSDGKRLRDHGRFGDVAETAQSLLIECGYHGDPLSRVVAHDAVYRLMRYAEIVESGDLPIEWLRDVPSAKWILEVTHAVVAKSMDFSFASTFGDLPLIQKQGTVIAFNAGVQVLTPYDDCVLVMPSLRQLRPGVTMVRLARRTPIA